MGILHDIVYVVKVGDWKYAERERYSEAERIVNRMKGIVLNIRVEEERRVRE